jgi:hypothetical protein
MEESPFKADDLNGPYLLFGGRIDAPLNDLITSLPSRSIADSLVRQFVQGIDIPPFMLHIPTFLKEYEIFWDNSDNVSLAWLAELYSVMCLTVQFMLRSDLPIEGVLLPEATAHNYMTRAAQCLLKSDYAKPDQFTVQAMVSFTAVLRKI